MSRILIMSRILAFALAGTLARADDFRFSVGGLSVGCATLEENKDSAVLEGVCFDAGTVVATVSEVCLTACRETPCADDADRSTCLADGLCAWDGTKHDGACADAADPGADEFTFERGGKTRTCAWVAKKPKKNKRKICEENAGRATRRVGLACPAACAVEAEPSAMVTCEDSPTFKYKKWTCAKIAKAKDKKKTKICSSLISIPSLNRPQLNHLSSLAISTK